MCEGHLMADHVHMCFSIPPKYAVSSVVGFIKGKSAISIARNFLGRKRNFTGESFWARGYFVSTVGLDEEVVRQYIRRQEQEEERLEQLGVTPDAVAHRARILEKHLDVPFFDRSHRGVRLNGRG